MPEKKPRITTEDVRDFWERNPLCAHQIPHPPGSPEFFAHFDRLRNALEPLSFLEQLLAPSRLRGKQVLDVGCGNGYILSLLARAQAITTGIDITPKAIQISQERFKAAGLDGRFLEANAEALPFPDSTFDCVFSLGVLHHTPDTEKAVAEIFRVLRPGGRLIMMLYHRNSFVNRVKHPIACLLTGKPMAQAINEVDGKGNPKGDVYSKGEMRLLFKQFVIEKIFARLLVPRWARQLDRRIFDPFHKKWGWFLYLTANKPD